MNFGEELSPYVYNNEKKNVYPCNKSLPLALNKY